LNPQAVSGCFYLDSNVIFSDILEQNKSRIKKFKDDVANFNITCYVSQTVADECKNKIDKTADFLGNTLNQIIVTYLEGIRTSPRDLKVTAPSNDDLKTLQDAFLTINQNAREFDLISDPLQAVEEWVVVELDKEVVKPTGITLNNFILSLTMMVLMKVNNLQADFEKLVEMESDYVKKSSENPDQTIINKLVAEGVHRPDADHISVVGVHNSHHTDKAIFLTLDYKSIILRWVKIRKLTGIECSDPIYGLSHLR
jgi:hypothetical protein